MELKREVLSGGVLSIRVVGHVDVLTAPKLEKEITDALALPQARCVVDLAQVDYMSSAGLRVLMKGARAAADVQGRFAVCSIQEPVHHVLSMVGFLTLIEIHENHDLAVEAVSRRADGQ